MKRLGLLWMVVYTAISCNVCWGMLSYPEENELHCRSCHAPSAKNTADRHHESGKAKTTGCLGCHPRNADTTLKEIVRDCKKCHVNPGTRDPFTGAATTKSPHHNSVMNSECIYCHNVSTILNPPQDQYSGRRDPAPTPIVPERRNETISFPVTMEGVPQTLGVPDVPYGNLTPQDCKACHLRHGEESTASFHHQSARLETDGCTYCHVISGGIQVPVQRNCLICHVNKGVQDPFTGEIPQYTVHHRSAAAIAEDCTACHSDTLVRPVGTGLSAPYSPTNPPSLVTPTMQTCRNCHSAGPAGVSTARLHHAASENCTLCHTFQQYETTIRDCQSCHTYDSLHKIPGHTAGTDRCIGCHGDYLAYETPVLEVSPVSRAIFTDNAAFNIAGRVFSSSGMSSLTINDESVPFDEAGYFSYLQPLQPGLNNIVIRGVGANGTETTETKEITLIEQSPAASTTSSMTIKSPADNSVVSTRDVTVEGTSAKGASLSLKHNKIDSKRVWPRGKKFKMKVALTPGLNTLEFTYAKKGKQITKKRTVIYTPVQPALAITIPGQDIVTAEQAVNLQGEVPKGAVVTVTLDTETVATFNAAGKFTVPVYLDEERKYTIQMTAVEADGRSVTTRRNIIFKRK